MKVAISYGAAAAIIDFESGLARAPNAFSLNGDITKEELVHDVSVAGANPVMGYAQDAEDCISLVLLRTLEFMGYEVQWPESWIAQALQYDAEEMEAAEMGIVN